LVVSQRRPLRNEQPAPGGYTVQGIGNGFQSKLTPVPWRTASRRCRCVADRQASDVVPNGWIRRPGRVAATSSITSWRRRLPEGEGKAIVEAKCGSAISCTG